MSLKLLVSPGGEGLRPMARNLFRAAALQVDCEIEFQTQSEEKVILTSGEGYPKAEELLALLRGVNIRETISRPTIDALESLAVWIGSVKESHCDTDYFPLPVLLEEVRKKSLFYLCNGKNPAFEPFWEKWERYYPLPQHFEIVGTSQINETNKDEASDYAQAHEEARSGVKSIDNAVESLLATIPHDVESILDIGSGPGYVNRRLPPDYSILAMDIDEAILRGNVRRTCIGDIMDIPLPDNSVDMIMACDMLEHLPEDVLQKGIAELERVSRKYLYLQVPVQEDPLMSMAYCPACGNVWHVNHHKRRFNQQQLVGLLSEKWKTVCVNYTGDLLIRRPGNLEQDFAERLNWKLYGVEDAVCPQCGEKSRITGEEYKKFVQRLANYDTDQPFPVYTEIGILFCRKGEVAEWGQSQPLSLPYEVAYRNELIFDNKNTVQMVYTGGEMLPCIYTMGCAVQGHGEGCSFQYTGQEKFAWVAMSFPSLPSAYRCIEIVGCAVEGESDVAVGVVDADGKESYVRNWMWSQTKEKYILPFDYDTSYAPMLVKLYFQSGTLKLFACKLQGGQDAEYIRIEHLNQQCFTFDVGDVRYQLLMPPDHEFSLSHVPAKWLEMTTGAEQRKNRALQRFVAKMSGRMVTEDSLEPDNRGLISKSIFPTDYLCCVVSDLEESSLRICDEKSIFSVQVETVHELLSPQYSIQEDRGIVLASMFVEAVLQIYEAETVITRRQRVKEKLIRGLKRKKKTFHAWLRRHERVYDILISLGLKELYFKLRRRMRL